MSQQQIPVVSLRPDQIAVLLSVEFHALLLCLNFGGDEFGAPGFVFPWQDRRGEVPELRVIAPDQLVACHHPNV